jgi:hypothetical protein
MSDDGQSEKARAARRTNRRHTLWAWFWFANIPPVVGSYLLLERDVWEASMLVYLAVVSIWANAATHLSRAGAAAAEEASFENP